MASTSTGSCLCQAVKYRMTGEPLTQVLCHCESCQKVTGSAFTANCLFGEEHIEVVEGTQSIKTYEDRETASGQPLARWFCRRCGSNLFVRPKGPDGAFLIAVSSGTMDERAGLHPKYEFFCRNRRSWLPAKGVSGAEQRETQ